MAMETSCIIATASEYNICSDFPVNYFKPGWEKSK